MTPLEARKYHELKEYLVMLKSQLLNLSEVTTCLDSELLIMARQIQCLLDAQNDYKEDDGITT